MTKNEVSPLNCVEIEKILEELKLGGCILRDIVQPDYKSLVLKLYRFGVGEFRLMLDLNAQKSSLYPLKKEDKLKNRNLRFVQIMRSQCRGGRIISTHQYEYQRIIVFHVKHIEQDKYLYVRLWGTRSNIFLCDTENNILDVFFRRPGSKEASGCLFTLPSSEKSTQGYNLRVLEGIGSFADRVRIHFYQNTTPFSDLKQDFLSRYTRKSARIDADLKKTCAQIDSNYKSIEQYGNQADKLMEDLYPNFNADSLRKAQDLYQEKKKLQQKNQYLEQYKKSLEYAREELRKQYELKDDEDFLLSTQKNTSESKKISPKGLSFIRDGIVLLVGRNAGENDFLLRHVVKPHDGWMHVRGYGGCYVFIRTKKNQIVPDNVRLDACALAMHYSKAKNETHADIHYTQVKYLRRIKDCLGKVSVTREKNICYRRDEKRLADILSRSHDNVSHETFRI